MEGDEIWNRFIQGLKKSGIRFFLVSALYICKYPPLSYYTKSFAVITYGVLAIFHFIAAMTIKVAQGDIFRISESLFYFSIIIPSIIGFITVHSKRQVIEQMFSTINDEFHNYNLEDTKELKTIHEREHMRYLNIQKFLQYLIFITYFVWAIIAPIYGILYGDGSEKINPQIMYDLPVPIWVPFETRDRSVVLLFYFAQVFLGFAIVLLYSSYVMSMVGFSMQIITQLKMLGHSIRKLEERANCLYNKLYEGQWSQPLMKMTKKSPDRDYSNCLHYLFNHNIVHYNKIVSFFYMFLEFTQTLAAVVLGESVLILCNGLFILTTIHGINANTIKFTLLLCAVLLNNLFFCVCGTLISLQSDDVRESLYFSSWYNFPETLKRSIRIMQIRTSRNLVFQAGIFPLNLNTFVELLRATYSVFNVLNYANKDNY